MPTDLRKVLFSSGLAVAFLFPGAASAGTILVDAGRGNVPVRMPDGGSPPYPLVVFLHGYNSSAAASEALFSFGEKAEAAGMLYATPDGTQDLLGLCFWNATDGCCNFFDSGVDDASYLAALVAAPRAVGVTTTS